MGPWYGPGISVRIWLDLIRGCREGTSLDAGRDLLDEMRDLVLVVPGVHGTSFR